MERKMNPIDIDTRPICKDVQASENPFDKLYNATPGCDGRIYSNFYNGGGVKCTKCAAWFCF